MRLITEFIDSLKDNNKSSFTVKNYQSALSNYLKWHENSYGEDDISKAIERDIRDYQSYLKTITKQKPASINFKIAVLRSFYKWVLLQGHINRNPVDNISNLKEIKTIKTIDTKDLRRILREVHTSDKTRDIAIIELLINTGIRIGELTNIKMEDVSISPRKGNLTICGKGSKTRTLPLNNDARKAILVSQIHRHAFSFTSWVRKSHFE